MRRKLASAIICVALALVLFGCGKQERGREYTDAFWAMDTLFEVKVISEQENTEEILEKLKEEINRIEQLTSRYVPVNGKNLASINENSGVSPVVVDEALFDLISLSLHWSKKTDGNFSITLGPVMDLWRENNNIPPTKEAVEAVLPLCDYSQVILDEKNLSVYLAKKGMSLDLGAVAKGYALDRGKELLLDLGITQGIINGGGSVITLGSNAKGQPWKIGVKHPRNEDELATIVEVIDLGVISSGDYQRYFEYEGKRYHHIIDPKTGYPAQGAIGVTVLSNSATVADILSTTILVEGIEGLERYKDSMVGGFLMDAELSSFAVGQLKN